MTQILNHVAVAAPRNGTATHTVSPSSGVAVAGAAFSFTAGRFGICIVEGAVTSTTPSTWTLPSGASAINNTGLYVFNKATLSGGDSVTTTHNGSNYPVVFHFIEFAAGTTWVNAASAIAVDPGTGTSPTLTGLTGANQVYGVAGQSTNVGRVGPYAGSWDIGTEVADTSEAYSATDGYTYGVSELVDHAASTATFAWISTNGVESVERIVFAVQTPAGPGDPPVPLTDRIRLWSETLPRGGSTLWETDLSYVYTPDFILATIVSGNGVTLEYWDGAAWQTTARTYWDGAAWQTELRAYWNGSVWQ